LIKGKIKNKKRSQQVGSRDALQCLKFQMYEFKR